MERREKPLRKLTVLMAIVAADNLENETTAYRGVPAGTGVGG
jgi:hypothetical protein